MTTLTNGSCTLSPSSAALMKSKILFKSLQLNDKTTNNPIRRQPKDLNSFFSKEDKQRDKSHMKRSSPSLNMELHNKLDNTSNPLR